MNSEQFIIDQLKGIISKLENDIQGINSWSNPKEKEKTIAFALDLAFYEKYKPDNWDGLTYNDIHEYSSNIK